MNKNYEVLETFSKNKETWSYLRHKKTGLEIAFHKCKTEETGFSFNIKTPMEQQYLGTAHVLEHCVLQGSRKFNLPFPELKNLCCFSNFNAFTDLFDTKYFFYSVLEDECLKLIPILGDYVFFPELSEEAFMQECMRVEFDPCGDKRKKKISGVVYNEMKASFPVSSIPGGAWYKLCELTNEKIKEYHKKYYRPDNCLFVFNGNASLKTVLESLEPLVSDLEEMCKGKTALRKNMTVQEFLTKVPFKKAPANLEHPELASWLINEKEDICSRIESYWTDGFSPLMPFVLDEKYGYSAYKWWVKHNPEYKEEPKPPKKTVPEIISEYLGKYSTEEYMAKLEKLHEWQARDVSKQMIDILKPLAVTEYDTDITLTEKELQEYFDDRKDMIKRHFKNHGKCEAEINGKTCCITIRPSTPVTKKYYAEYALCLFLKGFLSTKLRRKGYLYDLGTDFFEPYFFGIVTFGDNNPKKTLELLKETIAECADYDFSETDLLIIKSEIFSCLFQKKDPCYFTDKIYEVTKEDLHKAAVRFSKMCSSLPPA